MGQINGRYLFPLQCCKRIIRRYFWTCSPLDHFHKGLTTGVRKAYMGDTEKKDRNKLNKSRNTLQNVD